MQQYFMKYEGKAVIGFCRAEELDQIKIKNRLYVFEYGKATKSYLQSARTVIVIGVPVQPREDVVNRGIIKSVIGDDYPGYKEANLIAKKIENELQSNRYKSKVATGISYKNAAVLSGLGAWGKNALIINKTYGTMLRFAAVVTEWVPEAYGNKMVEDYCNSCSVCVSECPFGCLEPFFVDSRKCYCKYIKRGQFSLEIPMCDICQRVCPYNQSFFL